VKRWTPDWVHPTRALQVPWQAAGWWQFVVRRGCAQRCVGQQAKGNTLTPFKPYPELGASPALFIRKLTFEANAQGPS
jgi:hypothetical protein